MYQLFHLHLSEVFLSKENHFSKCKNNSLKLLIKSIRTHKKKGKLEFKQIATDTSWNFSPIFPTEVIEVLQ